MDERTVDEATLSARFEAVTTAAGGRERPDWLASATEDPTVGRRLADLAAELPSGDHHRSAKAYADSLSSAERAANGHFATDPAIATALCRWAIRPVTDGRVPRVLDPAVGSGVFTHAAAERLGTLAPDTPPQARLENVVGVDVDPIPLALSARRLLETAGLETAPVSLYETDFFATEPGPDRTVSVDDDAVTLGRFDAVVGNPPYVRQEDFDVDRARAHLATLGPSDGTPYLDGDRALSRRSDAYVYFVTQATRFLRPGGRLGMVLPGKWLTTRYGESFRRFLFDHYRVEAVVGFGARAFDDALVDTVLLLAERCPTPATRRETPVRFCRLDDQVPVTRLVAAVDSDPPASAPGGRSVRRTDALRTVTVSQATLADEARTTVSPYLSAPGPFIDLLSTPALEPLSTFGSVKRGVMTGANEFFFLDADGRAADVDDRFLRPAIKSIRDVTGTTVRAAETDRYLLDVHDYVDAVARSGAATDDDGTPEDAVVDALDRDGYDGLRAYLEWGRRQGFHRRSSCRARQLWFDLGDLTPPSVFVPKFFDERVVVVANPDGLLASNAVDCLWVDDDVDDRTLQGILSSTVTKALIECWGRSEGGGALQVMTYELETLPVPDPRSFSADRRRAIVDATNSLLAGESGAGRRLDRLVLAGLDVDMDVDRCRTLRDRMVRRRVTGGAETRTPFRDG
jgi:SAM-dependent methyltransferase